MIETLRRMAGGFLVTQILNTACRLNVADRLASGSRSAAELAPVVGADPSALCRFLRMMVVLQLLVQESGDTFGLAPLGELLRSDHPQSQRDRILYLGEINYPSAQSMLHSVQTGKPAFDAVFGEPFFAHLARRTDLGTIFNQLMTDEVNDRAGAILNAYDFRNAATVVDVGGGSGALLAAILRANAGARGVVFDVPGVAAETGEALRRSDIGSRIDVVGGDLFRDALPPDADIYVLMHVIHDWNDVQAGHILRSCRSAVRTGSRLLLIEELVPVHVSDAPATIATDFSMLLFTGGAERTEAEYRALISAAGFQVAATIPFHPAGDDRKSNWAILECR